MREKMKSKVTTLAIFATRGLPALAVIAMGGCASVPAFHPSQSLDAVPSLYEGLLLCHEYRLPAEPSRPVLLRPYLDCLDTLAERYPASAVGRLGRPPFATFRDEFHLLYGLQNDVSWTPRLGVEIEIAAQAALKGLWRGDGPPPTLTAFQREVLLKNFPATSKQLRVTTWPVSDAVAFDPKLETLKAGLAALEEKGAGPPEWCTRLSKLRSETRYLAALSRDIGDVSLLDSRDSVTGAVRSRLEKRLANALHEVDELRTQPQVGPSAGRHEDTVLACPPTPHA
jgi:hypothetical protein